MFEDAESGSVFSIGELIFNAHNIFTVAVIQAFKKILFALLKYLIKLSLWLLIRGYGTSLVY